MISWLDAKTSLNYLYPVPERIIFVFCWHSWPHKKYTGEQLTLLVSCWLVLKALYTFKKYTIALVLISINYGTNCTIWIWSFNILFPHFSLYNALKMHLKINPYQLSQGMRSGLPLSLLPCLISDPLLGISLFWHVLFQQKIIYSESLLFLWNTLQ